ncbi:MAG: histidinol-phosphate transaminase [Desulfobacter sp.]
MTEKHLTAKELYAFVKTQHGGFHRHGFTDHAYLYNLYFPPPALIDHLKNQMPDLIRNYPVAQQDLAELVGQATGIPGQRLVVGNGAAELIKIICTAVSQRLIVPVPSFNEYINAAPRGQAATFALAPPDFRLDPERLVREAIAARADTAVVVSPNNPTALAVPARDLQWLATRLASRNIRLIVDESFIDFCDTKGVFSLESCLDRHPNLSVIKSMSKSYGICGLRLGYLATHDEDLLDRLRQGVHIWNINGFAEEFLRQLPGFADQFHQSCAKVVRDRDALFRDLSRIPDLTVYPTDANFLFCRLPDTTPPAPAVVAQLFISHNILVKDCSGKSMPVADRYLRIAARTPEENRTLASALASTLDTVLEVE